MEYLFVFCKLDVFTLFGLKMYQLELQKVPNLQIVNF